MYVTTLRRVSISGPGANEVYKDVKREDALNRYKNLVNAEINISVSASIASTIILECDGRLILKTGLNTQ